MIRGDLEKSKFCHVFEYPDFVCLYNSLTMELAYCKQPVLHILRKLQRPVSLESLLKSYAGQEELVLDCVRGLLQLGLLAYANTNQNSGIERIRDCISSTFRLETLYVVPSWKCNLACHYCHIRCVNRHDGTLSLSGKELNEGIDYFVRHAAANSGNKTVLFYGGEPLLNWNTVKNTIEIVRTKEREFNGHVNLVLFTNATVVTDSIANCLASSDVFVVVSVDGPAEFHDKMRVYPSGLGSFSKTRKGYFTLRDHGCKVGISTVIGSHNVDRLDEVVQYLNREFNPVDIGLSTLHFLPSGGNPALSGAQSTTASLIRVYEAARKHGLYVEHIMRRIRPFVEKTPRIKDCPACGGKILVAPGGKIGLCEIFTGLDKFLIHDSNLFSDPNYVMWNNRSQFLEESCLSCPALSLCGGGCPYDAYVLTGNLMGHDETRCVQSKQLLEWIIADLYRTLVTKLGDQRRQSEFALLVPSLQDRKLIYGNINYATPLDSYSTYGERVVV